MMPHDLLSDGLPQNVQSSEGDGKQTSFSDDDARVWLKATIADVDKDMDGRVFSLLIGTARVSVLVEQEHEHFACWAAGMRIEMHIDRYEAWVKPSGRDGPPVLCGLLYVDHQSVASTR